MAGNKIDPATLGFPSAGDTLFRGTSKTVFLWKNLPDRRSQIERGYRHAADLLAGDALKSNADGDRLAFPLIFLYRHYFEISMKGIIDMAGRRAGVSTKTDHELKALWASCLLVFECLELGNWPGENDVGRLMAEFADMDPGSFAFRYHVSKKGQPIGPRSSNVDLVAFIKAADAIASFLEAIAGEVYERESWCREAESGAG